MLRKLLFAATILFLIAFNIYTSHADDKIKIRLHQPPPNLLNMGNLWSLDITNTTRENINIYLTGTATESKKGLIVSGKSKVISVSPGTKKYDYNDFKSGEVTWKDRSIQEVLLRTGNVPEGEYTICVTAFYEGGEVADQESCIEQSIRQQGSITLISPSDGAEIDPNQPVIFTWTPLPGAKEYTLKLVEVKGDESPEVAMKRGIGLLPGGAILSARYQLLPGEFKKLEIGKKYAWMVKSGNVESEIMSFSIKRGEKEVDKTQPTGKRIIIKWGRGYPAGSGNCHCCGICEIIIKSASGINTPDDNTGIADIYAIDDKTLEIKIDKKTGLTPAAYDTNFSTGYFVFDVDFSFGTEIMETLKMKEVVNVKKGSYKVTEKDGILTVRFSPQSVVSPITLFPDDKPFEISAELNSKIHGREQGSLTLNRYEKELKDDDEIYLLEASWAGATSRDQKTYEKLNTSSVDADYLILQSSDGELFALPLLVIFDPVSDPQKIQACLNCPTNHDNKRGCSMSGTFCFCLLPPDSIPAPTPKIMINQGLNGGIEMVYPSKMFWSNQSGDGSPVSAAFECIIPNRKETLRELKIRIGSRGNYNAKWLSGKFYCRCVVGNTIYTVLCASFYENCDNCCRDGYNGAPIIR